MNRIHLTMLVAALVTLLNHTHASTCINTEDFKPGLLQQDELHYTARSSGQSNKQLQREENRLLRFEKRIVHMQQRIASRHQDRIEGIGDSTDRWFWFWVIGWGAGLLLTILSGGSLATGALGIFWILSFAIGSVSLIIWLLKRFQ